MFHKDLENEMMRKEKAKDTWTLVIVCCLQGRQMLSKREKKETGF